MLICMVALGLAAAETLGKAPVMTEKSEISDDEARKAVFPMYDIHTNKTGRNAKPEERIQGSHFQWVAGIKDYAIGVIFTTGTSSNPFDGRLVSLQRTGKVWKLLCDIELDEEATANPGSLRFDMAPFRMSESENAIGFRTRGSFIAHNQDGEFEKLFLYRLKEGFCQRVFSEEMFRRQCYYDPGFVKRGCSEDQIVLEVEHSKTKEFFDWRLHYKKAGVSGDAHGVGKDRIFHWNGTEYEESGKKHWRNYEKL